MSLRLNDPRIHISSTVDGANKAMNVDLAIFNRDFRHVGRKTSESFVDGDPALPLLGQRFAPSGLLCCKFQNSEMTRLFRQESLPQLEWILFAGRCQFVEKTLGHKSSVRVSHRTPPQHRNANLRRVVLNYQIGNGVRKIGSALYGSTVNAVLDDKFLEGCARD